MPTRLPPHLLASLKETLREMANIDDVPDEEIHEFGMHLLDTIGLAIKINARTIRQKKFDSTQVSSVSSQGVKDEIG
jgi:hypothetical protein